MIERAKQKWDLQLSTSLFWKVSSNKLDRDRGVEECEDFHREPRLTSRNEANVLRVQTGKVKLIY